MALKIKSLGPSALELDVEGRLDRADYDKLVPMAEDRISEHGKVDLLIHIANLQGWSPLALWEDLKFDVKHYSDVSRVAIVTADPSKKWMATVSRPFTSAEVSHFPETEINAARAWVKGGSA